VALGQVLALDALEAPDRPTGEAPNLRELSRDGESLGADPVLDCLADPGRERRFELAASSASSSICARARSRAASTSPGCVLFSAAASSRSLARSTAL
jgi:hypothetical protein